MTAVKKGSEVAISKKITDRVLARINKLQETKEIQLPEDYSAENAMQSAWLTLQGVQDRNHNPALSVCKEYSIANSLLDMVIQGLNPGKDQCYFIVYGDELSMSRSYFGTQLVGRRIGYYVKPVIIWEGDEVERTLVNDEYVVTKHVSPWENHGGNIAGIYATVREVGSDKIVSTEMMTWGQVQKSWAKSKTYKYDNSTHKDYPDQMAKRTIIERALKNYINTRDDKDVLIRSFNATTKNEFIDDAGEADVVDDKIDLFATTKTEIPARNAAPKPNPRPAARTAPDGVETKRPVSKPQKDDGYPDAPAGVGVPIYPVNDKK